MLFLILPREASGMRYSIGKFKTEIDGVDCRTAIQLPLGEKHNPSVKGLAFAEYFLSSCIFPCLFGVKLSLRFCSWLETLSSNVPAFRFLWIGIGYQFVSEGRLPSKVSNKLATGAFGLKKRSVMLLTKVIA